MAGSNRGDGPPTRPKRSAPPAPLPASGDTTSPLADAAADTGADYGDVGDVLAGLFGPDDADVPTMAPGGGAASSSIEHPLLVVALALAAIWWGRHGG